MRKKDREEIKSIIKYYDKRNKDWSSVVGFLIYRSERIKTICT